MQKAYVSSREVLCKTFGTLEDVPWVILVTACGVIQGKISEKTDAEIHETDSDIVNYHHVAINTLQKEDSPYLKRTGTIVLEDVTIVTNAGKINVPALTVFEDHVIAVAPGNLDL